MEAFYIQGSDPMSSLTHLIGLVVVFFLSIPMVMSARRSWSTFLFTLQFAFSSLLLLTISSVFHMMAVGTPAREVMLRLDIAAIFVLIASTFTVLHGILFTGWKRWAIIGVLWTISVVGAVLRCVFFQSIPGYVGDGIFLLMGWIGALSAFLLWKEYRWRGVGPVVIGGVCYTVGALMNTFGWPQPIPGVWGSHETFHLFVLAGLGTHWALIWSIADGSFQRQALEPHQGTASSTAPRGSNR
jgi:channel protein (hemolysin III family)